MYFERKDLGKHKIVFYKQDDYPEIEDGLRSAFFQLTSQLNLKSAEGALELAHIISNGTIMDYSTFVANIETNEFDGEIRRFFDALVSNNNPANIEKIKITFAAGDDGKQQSFTFDDQKLNMIIVARTVEWYINNHTPKLRMSAYKSGNLTLMEIVEAEARRLAIHEKRMKEQTKHRPTANKRIYSFLALFFKVLEIPQCKDNYNLMIDLLKLFGIWNETIDITPSSYKLIIRQWHTAKDYDFQVRESDFPDISIFEDINVAIVKTIKYGLPTM